MIIRNLEKPLGTKGALLYRVNPVCMRSARQTARTMEVRAVLRHCVPYKGLHPLRRLCGYPCPLWMGNNLFAQTVSHPKPKTQHANFTACPKDRRYFYLQIKSANKKSIGNERKIADLVGSPKMAKQKDRRANAGQIERV